MKRILIIVPYSEGICGVFQRAKQEAEELKKRGHDVTIFSSNITKGTNKITRNYEDYNGIKINRFPAKKLIGESFMYWDFKKEFIKLNPEITIVHNYRHLHTTKALSLIKKNKIKSKIFLITHAPFVKKKTTRKWYEDILVNIYDKFIGRNTLNKFDKVITISKWEQNILKNIGVKENKIEYIPNSVPDIFYKKQSKFNKNNKILFLGRITPVKNIETIILAIKNTPFSLDIYGEKEEKYYEQLKNLIIKEKISNVFFHKPVYSVKEKIKIIDSHKIFVLSSLREAFGQSLLENMARKRIVVSSKTDGGKELIKDNKNGFLFNLRNIKELKKILLEINKLSDTKIKNMTNNAYKESEKYSLSKNIDKLEELF